MPSDASKVKRRLSPFRSVFTEKLISFREAILLDMNLLFLLWGSGCRGGYDSPIARDGLGMWVWVCVYNPKDGCSDEAACKEVSVFPSFVRNAYKRRMTDNDEGVCVNSVVL